MTKLKLHVGLLCVCLNAFSAHAQFLEDQYGAVNINKIMEMWNSGNNEKVAIVFGYLLATQDSITTEMGVCVPTRPGLGAVFKTVMKEAEAAKKAVQAAGIKVENVPAHTILLGAFRRAYPCQQRK